MHENLTEQQSDIPLNATGEADVGNYLTVFVNQQNKLPKYALTYLINHLHVSVAFATTIIIIIYIMVLLQDN